MKLRFSLGRVSFLVLSVVALTAPGCAKKYQPLYFAPERPSTRTAPITTDGLFVQYGKSAWRVVAGEEKAKKLHAAMLRMGKIQTNTSQPFRQAGSGDLLGAMTSTVEAALVGVFPKVKESAPRPGTRHVRVILNGLATVCSKDEGCFGRVVGRLLVWDPPNTPVLSEAFRIRQGGASSGPGAFEKVARAFLAWLFQRLGTL